MQTTELCQLVANNIALLIKLVLQFADFVSPIITGFTNKTLANIHIHVKMHFPATTILSICNVCVHIRMCLCECDNYFCLF